MRSTELNRLRESIIRCRRCPRLVAFRRELAAERRRRHDTGLFWGRPVPGVGDPDPRLLVVGLAPGIQGSHRTGRMFTGDRSAAFLVRVLHRAGFANQPTSEHRDDGLAYRDLYLTAAVRCVPPDNRPTGAERENCREYLEAEIRALPRLRSILCLGGFAWEAVRRAVGSVYGVPPPPVRFAHGAVLTLGPGRPTCYGSYHPSPQNTQTGRLTEPMLADLLQTIRNSWTTETS